MDVEKLLSMIAQEPDCVVKAPTGQMPLLHGNLHLPDDLSRFYQLCGGVVLFGAKDFWVEIVSPQDFVKANPLIRKMEDDADISDNWYRVARQDIQENFSIDLHPLRLGRCYDSFWDRHAVRGDSPIVAMTFTELLERLFNQRGEHWYWLEPGYKGYGDAYD